MSTEVVAQGLITYIYLVIIITFHEFGHAWMSSRCGDDTARLLGRVTLNPLAHLDPIGTVFLPIVAFVLSATGSAAAGFIIGWGRPVPVNIYNLNRPNRDDLLVAMAGPAMNVVIALGALLMARVGVAARIEMLWEIGNQLALFSMYLCFFNLLPVPPLDGGYLLKHFTRMTHEAFLRVSVYGFFIVIVLINIPPVRYALVTATVGSIQLMKAALFFP